MDTMAARYLEYMVHGFYNGLVSLTELEGISDEEMETVYALGYNFFTYGKYEAARDMFIGLTAHAPHTAHYWRALGVINQQLKDYPKAISAYKMAIAKKNGDLVSYVYRAESRILSGNVAAGLRDLEQVVKIGAGGPQPDPWVERSKLLLRLHRKS